MSINGQPRSLETAQNNLNLYQLEDVSSVPHCPTNFHLPFHRCCDRQLSLSSVPLGKSDLNINEPGI